MVYTLAAALIFRKANSWHVQGLYLIAVASTTLLIGGGLASPKGLVGSIHRVARPSLERLRRIASGFVLVMGITVGAMLFWLGLRSAAFLVEHRTQMSYESNFAELEEAGAYYRQMTCHQPDAQLLIYPLDPYRNFFAQLQPASKYIFMLPWVADIGQEELISDLKSRPALIQLRKEEVIWGIPVQTYLKDLITFLDDQYIEIEPGVYISPEIRKHCEQSGKIP